MTISTKELLGLLSLEEDNYIELLFFIDDIKEKGNIDFYKGLRRYYNQIIKIYKRRQYKPYTIEYGNLLKELRNNAIYSFIPYVIDDSIYKEFKGLCHKILDKYDAKEEMINNIKHLESIGIFNVEYCGNIDSVQRVYHPIIECGAEKIVLNSVFYTDGQIDYIASDEHSDTFNVRDASYIMPDFNRIYHQSVNISDLLFKDKLPTMDELSRHDNLALKQTKTLKK